MKLKKLIHKSLTYSYKYLTKGLETTLNGNNIDLTDQMSLMSENSNNAALANKVYQSISGLLKSAVGDK